MGMGSVVPNVELGQTGSSFEMWHWYDDTIVSTRVLFESTCVSPLPQQDIATDHNSTPCLLNFLVTE